MILYDKINFVQEKITNFAPEFQSLKNMNFPLFIARRIYSKNDGQRMVSKPAIRIATAGVAIGLAVMIVSVSVVLASNTRFATKWWASAATFKLASS